MHLDICKAKLVFKSAACRDENLGTGSCNSSSATDFADQFQGMTGINNVQFVHTDKINIYYKINSLYINLW